MFYSNFLFYFNGIKIVPSNIEKYLTPIGLAYWTMDDGNKQGSGFLLNTHSFTQSEVELLSKILLNKFNLVNTIQINKNGYRIYIKTQSIVIFKSLVTPYFHSTILYKLI